MESYPIATTLCNALDNMIAEIGNEENGPKEKIACIDEFESLASCACNALKLKINWKEVVRPQLRTREEKLKKKEKPEAVPKPSIDLEAESGEEGNPIDVDSDGEEEKF